MKFNTEIENLVKEFNINSRANKILYRDKEVADLLKATHDVDRFIFANRCNRIFRELIPLITPFHNTKVIVKK